MKKILMVAYYFPPLGMGGTQRPAKFARYLPEFGWQPTVITVKPIAYWAQDQSQLDELKHVRIIRTESLDPQRMLARFNKSDTAGQDRQLAGRGVLNQFNKKLVPFFLIPDSKILWKQGVIHKVAQLLRQEHFDALYTTSPPHSVHLIGRILANRFGLKWIVDFRDSWAGGVVVHEPTKIHRLCNQKLQQRALNSADKVIAVSEGIARQLKKNFYASKVHVITNGFDPADFPESEKSEKFTFCHCGSITRFSHPDFFLQAVAKFFKEYPKLKKTVRFQFVGYDALGTFMETVERLQLSDVIEHLGYQPHHRALKYVVQAGALVLIARSHDNAHFIPGKVFEYIGARKPILAMSNVPDTLHLLRSYPAAIFAAPEDVNAIVQAMNEIVNQHISLKREDENFVNRFNRKFQTRELAQLLDDMLAER